MHASAGVYQGIEVQAAMTAVSMLRLQKLLICLYAQEMDMAITVC